MLNIVRAYMFNSYVCMPTFYVSIHKKVMSAKMILSFYISQTRHYISQLLEMDFAFYLASFVMDYNCGDFNKTDRIMLKNIYEYSHIFTPFINIRTITDIEVKGK